MRFTAPLDLDTVLSSAPGDQANNALTGTITLVQVDPATGNAVPVPARVFVNGQTYAGEPVIERGEKRLAMCSVMPPEPQPISSISLPAVGKDSSTRSTSAGPPGER